MKISIVLLFVLLNAVNFIELRESYGFSAFLKNVKSDGLYEMFIDIRDSFGNDVAVETCHQIYRSDHCEELILIYIPKYHKRMNRRSFLSLPEKLSPAAQLQNYTKLYTLFIKYKEKLMKKIDLKKLLLAIKKKFPKLFGF